MVQMFYKPSDTCQVPDLAAKWEALFGRRNLGFFVEVGAYDGHSYSNTSCLADVGWLGLYIEPITEFADRCRVRHAKNAGIKILDVAVSDSTGTAEIFVGDTLTTLVEEQVTDYEAIDWARGLHKGEKRTVSTVKLDDLLTANGVEKDFDLLVVDVEGAEEKVINGFSLGEWTPKVVLIELEDAHPDFMTNARVVHSVRSIRNTIENAGYVLFFKDHINSLYVRNDVLAARLLLISAEAIDARGPLPSKNAQEVEAAAFAQRKRAFMEEFRDSHYLRHNQRRQEHLASLGLDIAGRSVLELGAGIGDHTGFFIDRNCSVCVSDGRPELYAILRERFHWMRTELLDLDKTSNSFRDVYDVVYAYGLLYHLNDPRLALETMARWCGSLLLVETCVSQSGEGDVNPVPEWKELGSQAISGTGCRPTRAWIFEQLKSLFPFVYATSTQPWHPEFPLDWSASRNSTLSRAIFVASRIPLALSCLLTELPSIQTRH